MIALGFVNVSTLAPTVVAPRLVLAVAAVVAPVPPLTTGSAVPDKLIASVLNRDLMHRA